MICKFCFAELDEDVTVCPLCGKELKETGEVPAEETEKVLEEETEEILEEETEEAYEEYEEEEDDEEDDEEYEEVVIRRKKKKKMPKALAVTLAVLGSVILAGALLIAVLYGMGYKFNGLSLEKTTYIVSDKKAQAKAKEVVATVGDQVLTNEKLQVFYWLTVQNSSLSFDTTKPLSKQMYNEETGTTLEQYFLEMAIEAWRGYATFVQLAQDDGYKLEEDVEEYLKNYKTTMDQDAVSVGYADAEAYLDELCSKASSADAYCDYVRMVFTTEGYLESEHVDMAVTEQEMEAFYAEHEDEFKSAGVDKSAGKYYTVRHILIASEDEMPEGGFTDAQWQACRADAQKVLDDFLAGDSTEEMFAQLAVQHSADGGSIADGGRYYLTKEGAIIDGMIQPFATAFMDWCLDESRKPGDTGLVKYTGGDMVGYHIMYFSDSTDIWKIQAEEVLRLEKQADILAEAEPKYPMTVDYEKVVLGQAELGDNSQTY